MKKINDIMIAIVLIVMGLAFTSCEDPAPNDYVPEYYVEAYLYVDEPISGLKLYKTQPLNLSYSAVNAIVKDADVKLKSSGEILQLEYRDLPESGYYYSDTSYKVKERTEYELEININSGKKISGVTMTPGKSSWVKKPFPEIYYPKDTMNLREVDSLKIEWEAAEAVNYYFIRTYCKDTLNYGKYLEPQSVEMNRRCYNILKNNDAMYKNLTNWGFIGNTKTPTVWLAFKWFGPHEVTVIVPDDNLIRWFMNIYFTNSTYHDPNFNSVKGAMGVFGSAYQLKSQVFLHKNQP